MNWGFTMSRPATVTEEQRREQNRSRQARFQEKTRRELAALREGVRLMIDALATAEEQKRSRAHLTAHLPDDPAEALQELTNRLSNKHVIVCRVKQSG